MARRWPTLLALVMAGLSWGASPLKGLSEALLVFGFGFGYLAAAVVGHRRATWVICVALLLSVVLLRSQDLVDPALALIVAAATPVMWGAVRGRLWPPGDLLTETAGMVLFTTIGLTALVIAPDLGRYLLAAGWLGHTVWDVAHLRTDTVVSRSFAEWCAVFDFIGGISILAFSALRAIGHVPTTVQLSPRPLPVPGGYQEPAMPPSTRSMCSEHGAVRITASATRPNSAPWTPPRPCVVSAIRSASCARACSAISSVGGPSSR